MDTVIFYILRKFEMREEILILSRKFYDCQIGNILYHNQTKDCESWNLFSPEEPEGHWPVERDLSNTTHILLAATV